jgi:hypothetical protein
MWFIPLTSHTHTGKLGGRTKKISLQNERWVNECKRDLFMQQLRNKAATILIACFKWSSTSEKAAE